MPTASVRTAPHQSGFTRAEGEAALGRRGPDRRWRNEGAIRTTEVALIALLALAARLPFLDHTPHEDEINHVLAARSLLSDGTLSIGGGPPYDRAWVFTYLVAGMFRAFGESLVVGRVPALVFGALLVVAVFVWTRKHAGSVAAWFAALLLTFAPVSLHMSQWIRFYTLHALLVALAAIAVFRLVSDPRPRGAVAAALGIGAGAALVFAFHLQVTTVVAAGGIVLGASLARPGDVVRMIRRAHTRRWILPTLALVAGAAAVYALQSGMVDEIRDRLAFADLWAEYDRSRVRFYHQIFLAQYPPLWTLTPVAVLIAAAHRYRFTVFCTTVFVTAFVFHSLVAWKTERYLFYALPFLFVIWGVAAAAALPWLRRQVETAVRSAAGGPVPRRTVLAAQALAIGGAVLFAAASSPAVSFAHKMLTVSDRDWRWMSVAPYRGWPDWEAGARELAPLVERSDVVLSSSEINSLWALGRIDIILRRSTTRAGIIPEFGMWRKVPVPVISMGESLARVMGCYATGLVVLESHHWRSSWGVPHDAADFLEAHATPVDLTPEHQLMAFRWSNPTPAPIGGDGCDGLPSPAASGPAHAPMEGGEPARAGSGRVSDPG